MSDTAEIAAQVSRVVGSWAVDKIRRPSPRTAQDIPTNIGAISEEWLTAVLCAETPGACVTSWHSPGGSSGTSERAALRVTYNSVGQDAGLPTELFTKSSNSLQQRILLTAGGMLMGETEFYFRFRPRVQMEAPLAYWGAGDPNSGRSFLVFEDIAATKGARFVDATEVLTRPQVEDVLTNLAVLHGTFWGSSDLAGIKSTATHIRNISGVVNMGGRSAVGLKKAADSIPPGMADKADRVWAGTLKSLQMLHDGPQTLLHGDPHVGQAYVTGDVRMGLTDWQLILAGGWAHDVASFIGSSVEPQDRRAWERELIGGYLDKLGNAGGRPPSFDEAFLAYRRSLFYYTAGWAFTYGRAWYQPEMQSESTCLAILHRLTWAIEDLDSFEAVGV